MNNLDNAVTTLMTLFNSGENITEELLEERSRMVLAIPLYAEVDRSELIARVRSLYRVTVGDFRIIEREERKKKWLDARRADIKWDFWNSYRSYLKQEKKFAPASFMKLDRLTDRILDCLFDPTINVEIDKRGLVVGQVQSGKTANYTGLVCKGLDAGYRLIIVLAGVHNDLRSQTQSRIDEGVLGFDTQYARAFNLARGRIGVGKYSGAGVIAHSLTSSLNNGDFSKKAAESSGFNFDTQEPLIAVVKKNSSILKRIYEWLRQKAQSEADGKIGSKALMLIDDEADHASINTRPEDADSPTVINGRIRSILTLFRKSAYVGYTATPFANIFIPMDDDNLFPRDFIINVPSPSNYMGPEKIFGFQMPEDDVVSDDVYPVVNRVSDYATFVPDKHRKDGPLPLFLPESLKNAIRSFILACAIRRVRGQKDVHNSMLVHVSRFQRWQDHIKELVDSELTLYRNGIELADGSVLSEFKDMLMNDDIQNGYRSFRSISELILKSSLGQDDPNVRVHSWEEVEEELYPAVSRINVRAIHGNSADSLEYTNHPKGLSVIAIGGDKLSRGLTLEGLSVSYYLRATKMYDTLMQMGRWFGYRDGYVDLCRLFTSRELNEWFCHITKVSEELRDEFDYMAERTGASPEEYALKVRTHHGQLQISATNKIRTAVNIEVTWSGRLVESYEFSKNISARTQNLMALRAFIGSLGGAVVKKETCYLWYDIPAVSITSFLDMLDVHESLRAYDPKGLIRFINEQFKVNELTAWSVALMNNRKSRKTEWLDINGRKENIGCFLRNCDENNTDEGSYYLRKSHLISGKDESIDLSDAEYEKAFSLTKIRAKDGKEPKYPSGAVVRGEIRLPQNPLLLVYPLDSMGARLVGDPSGSEGDVPYIGYAISFPASSNSQKITYAVHEQLLDKLDWREDSE
ncbi:MAG: Z1 domain-containing protein [Desulfobulbaceae bacterium]|nr:Z1 domain-containing protein [Desulfobulbaceae bacterium]